MNLKEINYGIPAHWPKLIEAGQIECAYKISVRSNDPGVSRQFRAVYDRCKAGFTDRYLDYAEERYGGGTLEDAPVAVFTVACVRARDWDRLREAVESVWRQTELQVEKI